MSAPFRTRRRVEFRDTDAAGIMHFTAFFDYMEMAEHELWRHLGMSVMEVVEEGHLSFPRVSARCDYRRSVKFEDELEIEVRVSRLGAKSVTFGFRFLHGEDLIAEGEITAVCCHLSHAGEPPRSTAIPDAIRERLAQVADEGAVGES